MATHYTCDRCAVSIRPGGTVRRVEIEGDGMRLARGSYDLCGVCRDALVAFLDRYVVPSTDQAR